mgnify:CR=1 FL=1
MAKNKLNGWGLAVLRIALGIILVYHGYLKLFASGGFPATVQFFASIDIPYPEIGALLSGVAEFFGGLFLILGVVTKLSCIALIINFLVAFLVVHLKNGLDVSKGGYEFVLLILASLLVVYTSGAGNFALGKLFKNKFLQ